MKEALTTKTARLLHSFQSVELRDEHRNYGDEGPYLRDFGFSPVLAARLIAWGETETLVCTFENGRGVSDGCHSWKEAFLLAACDKHLELFGEGDLPQDFLQWCANLRDSEMAAGAGAPRPGGLA